MWYILVLKANGTVTTKCAAGKVTRHKKHLSESSCPQEMCTLLSSTLASDEAEDLSVGHVLKITRL